MSPNDNENALRFLTTSERVALFEYWIENLRSNCFTNGTTLLRARGEEGWIYSPIGVLVQMLVDEPRYLGTWDWIDLVDTPQAPRPWLTSAMGLTIRCSAVPERSWHQHIEQLNRMHLTFRHIADVIEHRLMPDLAKMKLIPKK